MQQQVCLLAGLHCWCSTLHSYWIYHLHYCAFEILHAVEFRCPLFSELPKKWQKSMLFSKMGELKDKHEAMKQEQERTHSEQLDGLRHQYELSIQGKLVLWWNHNPKYNFHVLLELNKMHECLTCWTYFWCTHICNLFRAQQILQRPAAGSGQRYERNWSCFICKLNFTKHSEEQRNGRGAHWQLSEPFCPCRDRSKSWMHRTKLCLRS